MNSIRQMAMMFLGIMTAACAANAGPSDPDLIFRKSTTFKLLTPNDKLAVYGIDDPLVDGVVCHYTTPKATFTQGDVIFSERRSLVFKKMQIVRGCDTRRNILVYVTYSDKFIDGSPKNSTSTVPIQPWGTGEIDTQKCADFVRH
jgi:CreA protein